jgi:ketosteroid isomerase-like protein
MSEVRDRAGDVLTRAKRRVGIENPSAADADGPVGTVRGALRAFGEGNVDGFLDALRPDVTWEAPGGNFPGAEEIEGRDEVRDRFVGDVHRTYATFGFAPESYLAAEAESAVVAFGRFTGESAEGGGSIDVAGVQVWLFSGSEAEQVRIYTDGAAFPEVVTEQQERERQEQDEKDEKDEERDEEQEQDDG